MVRDRLRLKVADRIERTADKISEAGERPTSGAIAHRTKLPPKLVRNLLLKSPALAARAGYESDDDARIKQLSQALTEMDAEGKDKTIRELARHAGIDERTIRDFFGRHPEVKSSLGVMTQDELIVMKYRAAAEVLHQLQQKVTINNLVSALDGSNTAVRKFLTSHPWLIGQLGVIPERPRGDAPRLEERVKDAVAELTEENIVPLMSEVARKMGVETTYLSQILVWHPELKGLLGIMTGDEFRLFRFRFYAALLKDLEIPVGIDILADAEGRQILVEGKNGPMFAPDTKEEQMRRVMNVSAFLRRAFRKHPGLKEEMGVMFRSPGAAGHRK